MAVGPGTGPAPAAGEGVAPPRSVYLDNLKVLLIAGVIAGHGLIGYVDVDEVWAYNNVHEVTLSPVTAAVLLALILPFAGFLMALMFLMAGLLTPGALARKGPRRFAADRLLRLGVPFAIFSLLLWPAELYALYRPLGHTELSYWGEFAFNYPENGPLWFVGALLLFSLVYAGWRTVWPAAAARARPVTVQGLLVLAVAIALTSFLIRLFFEYGGQAVLDLNEWQWPECIGLFGVGIVAAGQGWLGAVPDRLRRQAVVVTISAGACLGGWLVVGFVLGLPFDDLGGGFNVSALVVAGCEGFLTVFGPIWLLSVAQRHLDHPLPHGADLARSSYGAFILQGVFLLGIAVALRPVPVVAEVKALVVAVGGVVGSYGLSWLLITRVPILRRVL